MNLSVASFGLSPNSSD